MPSDKEDWKPLPREFVDEATEHARNTTYGSHASCAFCGSLDLEVVGKKLFQNMIYVDLECNSCNVWQRLVMKFHRVDTARIPAEMDPVQVAAAMGGRP